MTNIPLLEWPNVLRTRRMRGGRSLDVDVDFDVAKDEPQFSDLVMELEASYKAAAPAEEILVRLSKLAASTATAASNTTSDAALAASCVEFLRRNPTTEAWSYLWSLRYHSSALELLFAKAVKAAATQDAHFKSAFLDLGAKVVALAAANPGRRPVRSARHQLTDLRDDWLKSASLLQIWQGLRHGGWMEYRDDEDILSIIADIDLTVFVRLLTSFDNPYPVSAALEASGVTWSFERWKGLIELAPLAFDEHHSWNGSSIVPLLLAFAGDQLSQGQFGLGAGAPDSAFETMAADLVPLADAIATVVAARQDAGGCFARWATWLMRHCLGAIGQDAKPHPGDRRSRGYADSVLIEALGRSAPSAAWQPIVALDADPWESWCHRCVLVEMAAAKLTDMPTAQAFIEQWQLEPEDWRTARGIALKERAALFEMFGKRADAYGTRLLAIPLAEAPEPRALWRSLWSNTEQIREIVEFGDHDDIQGDGFQGTYTAGQLMQLVFGLGLMMLDSVADPNRPVQSDRPALLEALMTELTGAVHEMAAIDRLNFVYWRDAFRHLAIRRALWAEASPDRSVALNSAARPSFGDYLRTLAGDTESLLALLFLTLKNGVGERFVREALTDAGIDIAAQVHLANRLVAINPKRSGITEEQLLAAQSLLPA